VSGESKYLSAFGDANQALQSAAQNLRFTYSRIRTWLPEGRPVPTGLSSDKCEQLDALAIRYARCQQMAGQAFKALALLEAEPQERFIDLLALMVKRGLVESIETWNRQRDLRNDAGHIYLATEKDFADYYTSLLAAAPGVAAYAERLTAYVKKFEK
jgi:hypothetical protein